ncbi:MAG TPA: heme iron utilization protein [Opitutae bacterium]|nr:heme iron utilization protein [Puniceicoccaceae bacterium]HBR94260.1 heme iron utilization protein [Opitutae bacterium]|tara:strand:+ start:8573 stop:8875 length:303 start_codon:yes stop_codon:yes gene_type:complete
MSTPESPLSSQDIARIIGHMNEDHADSVLAYAQHFGRLPEASAAQIVKLDADSLTMNAQIGNDSKTIKVPFGHSLESAHDAHMTMVQMSKAAKRALADKA